MDRRENLTAKKVVDIPETILAQSYWRKSEKINLSKTEEINITGYHIVVFKIILIMQVICRNLKNVEKEKEGITLNLSSQYLKNCNFLVICFPFYFMY